MEKQRLDAERVPGQGQPLPGAVPYGEGEIATHFEQDILTEGRPALRDKLGISSEAYFIAMGDTFQIWKPEAFDASESAVDELLDAMPAGSDIWTLLDDGEDG